MLPFLLNHSRLVLYSFGYQQALLNGLPHSKLFSNKCYEAASEVVRMVVQVLAPSGWLMYAPDEHFVFIGFAAAFLLRMLQPPFVAVLEPTQSSQIVPSVTHLTEVLASAQVSIDDQHSPHLYSRFLSGLIAKQSWIDNFLLPGFNTNITDAAGNPSVDVRRWYIMNRGAIFPGVGTNSGIMDVVDLGHGLHGINQIPDLSELGLDSTQMVTNSFIQRSSPVHNLGLLESESSSVITSLMDIPQVVTCLSKQGCANITDQLDQTSCSEYPISNGGFGDIYRGRLKSGVQIAIKTLRFRVGCGSDDQKVLK
ncbi:hypothetical protein FS749_015863, partial [Ceratobasidium sp. UAMH 11750]